MDCCPLGACSGPEACLYANCLVSHYMNAKITYNGIVRAWLPALLRFAPKLQAPKHLRRWTVHFQQPRKQKTAACDVEMQL